MWEFEGFKIFQQLLIPAFSGGIGGLAVVIMASLHDDDIEWKKYFKFLFLGAIAGIAAVNLLNPEGTVSQVMVLGLVAGLSAYSYLKRTALVDNAEENKVFQRFKANAIDDAEKFIESADVIEDFDELDDLTEVSDLEDTEEIEDSSSILKEKETKLQRYIDRKMNEFVESNPHYDDEEFFDFYYEIIEAVILDPKLLDLDE